MEYCKNHPGVPVFDRCVACAEPFCSDCLVEIQGQKYCASCKVMAVQGNPVAAIASRPCKEATEALTMAIIGLLICGIILEPMAISKANKAKAKIAADPTLTGSGKVTAAITIGVIGLALWVIGMIVRFASLGSR